MQHDFCVVIELLPKQFYVYACPAVCCVAFGGV